MSISAPDVTQDEDDREGTEVGIKPVSGKDARNMVEKLVSEGEGLVMADATMFELNINDIEPILDGLKRLKVLNFTVGLENGFDEILGVLGKKERAVEILEIVGVPGEGMVEGLKKGEGFVRREEVEALGGKWKGLKSLKVSVLRTKSEKWVNEGERWEKKA